MVLGSQWPHKGARVTGRVKETLKTVFLKGTTIRTVTGDRSSAGRPAGPVLDGPSDLALCDSEMAAKP